MFFKGTMKILISYNRADCRVERYVKGKMFASLTGPKGEVHQFASTTCYCTDCLCVRSFVHDDLFCDNGSRTHPPGQENRPDVIPQARLYCRCLPDCKSVGLHRKIPGRPAEDRRTGTVVD